MARGKLPWLLNARWKKAFAAATSRLARSRKIDGFSVAVDGAIEIGQRTLIFT